MIALTLEGERMRLHRLIGLIAVLFFVSFSAAANAAAYKNFRAAIYVTVGDTTLQTVLARPLG